jgi:hypothetical protein
VSDYSCLSNRHYYSAFTRIDKLKKPGKHNSFSLYTKENFEAFAERLGSTDVKVISRELGKAWKALSKEEKEGYNIRVREINQQRRAQLQGNEQPEVDKNGEGALNDYDK